MVHPKHGLETLAIIYSLPYALLMWGYVRLSPISFRLLTTADRMIFFVIAFLAESFRNPAAVPLVPVGVTALIVLVLVGWSSSCHKLGDPNLRAGCGYLSESVLAAGKWVKDLPRRIPAVLRSCASVSEKNQLGPELGL